MLTVLDIYGVAASIGKDFELLIENYGAETVSSLMPKIISILEELEEYATHFDSDEKEIASLQATISQLELDKRDRLQEKDDLNKELEQLEDHWKLETSNLTQLIQKLENDNTSLKNLLSSRSSASNYNLTAAESITDEEIQLMMRLKELIDRQKAEIKTLKRKIVQRNIDLRAVQNQVDRMAQVNAELRRKHFICKKQACELDMERSELENLIQSKNDLIRNMRENVYCPEEIRDRHLRAEMMAEDSDLLTAPSTSRLLPLTPTTSEFSSGFDDTFTDQSEASQSELADPKKPRFTLDELRSVLKERNELRSRLVE
ncbi:Rab interacting lysosomal protein-like 1, partial [Cichlidogyrus casuarinus]